MFRFQSHIKVVCLLKYYILTIVIVFGKYLVSKHCSDFPKCVEHIFFLKLGPFPLYMKSYVQICEHVLVPIIISLSIGTCPLNAITLDFNGGISIPNYFVLLCKVYNKCGKGTWLSAHSSVLSTVLSFISIPVHQIPINDDFIPVDAI